MRIAVAGKGGSGKTTLAAGLARVLAQSGRSVLAVDADSNPNLAVSLGIERGFELPTVPADLLEERTAPDGSRTSGLALPPEELARRYGVAGPDGVTLLVMGRVGHAGAG